MKEKMLEEFITFAKEEMGIEIRTRISETPDTFEKVFGTSFLENVEIGDLSYNASIKNTTISSAEGRFRYE